MCRILTHENINARQYLNVDYEWLVVNIPLKQKLYNMEDSTINNHSFQNENQKMINSNRHND